MAMWGLFLPIIPKEWGFDWNFAWETCLFSMPYYRSYALKYLTVLLRPKQEIHVLVPTC